VWQDDEGQELVEAAFVLPVLFAMILAIIWFGRGFNIYETITRAAREGARVAVAPTCASCGAPTCNWASVGGGTSNFPCADPTIYKAVTDELSASHISTASITAYSPAVTFCSASGLPATAPAPGCTTIKNVQICRGVQLGAATSNPQECGTLVSFSYQFPLAFPIASLSAVTLHTSVQMREEY
jgi:hypothetical protein